MDLYIYSARDARGITFEDAQDPNSTIRFTRNVAPKTVDGLKLTNVKTEAIVVRQTDPRSVDCTDCTGVLEPFSVRVSVNGSTRITAQKEKALATALKAIWDNRTVLLRGSLPTSDSSIGVDPNFTIDLNP